MPEWQERAFGFTLWINGEEWVFGGFLLLLQNPSQDDKLE
jgi:hypothetical protein